MCCTKKIQASLCCVLAAVVFLLFGSSLVVSAAANKLPTGPHSGNRFTSAEDDDIPIISDQFHRRRRESNGERRRSGRNSRRRRSSSRRRQHEEESDVDGDAIPSFPFFAGDNYDAFDDMGYQKRSRRRNRYNQSDPLLFGLGAQIDSLRTWTEAKTGFRLPRINIHCDPVTILKVRKAWTKLPGVIFRIGADFETYRLSGGYWKFRACCEDKFIGGRLTIKEVPSDHGDGGNDVLVEYSKSWMFAGVGAATTRFNLCAAYDIHTKQGGVRLGIRTENVGAIGRVSSSPFNGKQRFSVIPVLNLDSDDRFKLEVKTNFDIPNPELVLGMDLEGQSGSVGFGGSIDVEVEELNLIASF